jgi:hypothetical protein
MIDKHNSPDTTGAQVYPDSKEGAYCGRRKEWRQLNIEPPRHNAYITNENTVSSLPDSPADEPRCRKTPCWDMYR